MAALRPPRKGYTAWWRTTLIPVSWSRNSTRTCVKSHRFPQSHMLHETHTDTPTWRTFRFFLREKGWPAQKTDLEFSLGAGETSLRTVDSKLGSELGSPSPSRSSMCRDGLHDRRHAERTWSERGVSPTVKAGMWDWNRRCNTVGPKAFLLSVGLGLCGLSSLDVHLSPKSVYVSTQWF